MESFGSTGSALLGAALVTAVLHTLIPDHWLPFVLAGRARGWSGRTTAAVATVSALVHAVGSGILGAVAITIGVGISMGVGHDLEQATGILLILFGLSYAIWSWRKGGHFHPGGAWLHRKAGGLACDGAEGPDHPDHLHYHADDALISRENGPGAYGLAVIVGVNPCVVLLPLIVAAADRGALLVGGVWLTYSLGTSIMMVLLSVAGVVGTRRFRLPWAARHMEPVSGLLIAIVGLVVIFAH